MGYDLIHYSPNAHVAEPATEALPPGQVERTEAPVLEKVPLGQVAQYVDWLSEA